MKQVDIVQEQIQKFYDQHPYPPPLKDLDSYRHRWQDEARRSAEFHLHWPHQPYREDLTILVAGCGTSQAAKHALRNPLAQVVGIDLSPISIQQTEALKRKYKLDNLEIHQLPIERAGELGRSFDMIISTGVLHHLPDPDVGLRSLKEVLDPSGALHLMVYAAYGRYGVYMLQEYARLLGIGDTDAEITDFANTLMALPLGHPLARLLGESPDFRTKAGLADALLNPQDRAYTVPQLFEFISNAGLQFGRWVRQAPYLPQCGAFAETAHADRLSALPKTEQFTAMELLRGTMLRHSLIVYRDEISQNLAPVFDGGKWLDYVPIRLPETVCVEEKLPDGAVGVLINQYHTDVDIFMPIKAGERQMFEAIDGHHSILDIIDKTSENLKTAGSFFERLWWHDQIVFKSSSQIS